MGRRVTYSVHFEVNLGATPDGSRQEIRRTVQQIADVVNYVRSHFGNKYKDKVKPEDVKLMR